MTPEKQRAALQALDRMEAAFTTLRTILGGDSPPVTQATPYQPADAPADAARTPDKRAVSLPADTLGPTPDYRLEAWPQCVLKSQIVTDEASKRYRAVQIASVIGTKFDQQRILDVGCGEGHLAKVIGERAAKTIAYDLKQSALWLDTEKLLFTTDRGQVEKEGPYDLIIAYDVFDHLLDDEPSKFLAWLRGMLTPRGTIFVRFHPWTAKHGGHLYETVNKAYLHLALTPDELAQAGFTIDPNLKVVRPLATYEQWIKKAQLKIDNKRPASEVPDSFFSGPLLDRIIKITWGGKIEPENALKIMSNCFIDYWLSAE